MKKLKILCGAALLVTASGVQADIVSVSDVELAEVNGQLGYLDTAHIIAGLLRPAHENLHATDDALQMQLGNAVDGGQGFLNSSIDNAQANFNGTIDASQLNFINLQSNTEMKVANAQLLVKQLQQERKILFSSVGEIWGRTKIYGSAVVATIGERN